MNKRKLSDFDIIERYLEGELHGEELEEFESRIISDPEFASEVKLHRDLEDFLRKKSDYIKKREQLEKIYQEVIVQKRKTTEASDKPAKSHYIKLYYKIAAVIVLLIGVATLLFFILRPTKNEKLYAQYFKPLEGGYITRSIEVNPKPEDKYHMALDQYNDGHYEKSWKMFKELCNVDSIKMDALLYGGISAMEINNYKDAISSFKYILKANKRFYDDEANWYIALCYLKIPDIDKAKDLLSKISKSNSFYKENAATILKELNE
jgi:tetratricopeptide (TPR) repeat protein